LDPRHALAYSNRGNARRANGDLAGAMNDYDQALILDPRCALAFLNRGLSNLQQGREAVLRSTPRNRPDVEAGARSGCRRGQAKTQRLEIGSLPAQASSRKASRASGWHSSAAWYSRGDVALLLSVSAAGRSPLA